MDGPDLEAAGDEMFAQFNAAWLAGAPLVADEGVAPEVMWPDSPPEMQTQLSKGTKAWCRVTAKHHKRGVTSIGFGMPGQGRVNSSGTIMVNIFVPAGKRGLAVAARLGKVALAAFEGQRTANIWFTDAVPEEVGVDGAWFQYNVKATFHYDNHL